MSIISLVSACILRDTLLEYNKTFNKLYDFKIFKKFSNLYFISD